ncbi:MAG: ATP-dependent helicase HepA, partial [Thermoproteota archaeon]
MQTIKAGQRFMSEAEPELGLGLVTELQDKMIHLDFPAVSETRCYGIKSAPIKRIRFNIGDEVSSNEQVKFIVSEVSKTDEGQLLYISENGLQLLESNLLHSISFQRAEQKLLNASPDSDKLFQLRIKTAQIDSWLQNLPVRGLLGGRVSLIPHQLYIANEVTKRLSPRVLLADEVGLGKTIEAGLILHKLLITHKIERALIVLPNSLCFQWFVEMYRKYNLQFTVIDKINNELLADSNGQNLFDQNNLVITSIDLLSESEFALDSVQKVHWDMLIVDEAHKLKWQESNASKQYTIIEKLSKQINGLLLLTATPEMFGPKEHFSRLRLIDPDRFY